MKRLPMTVGILAAGLLAGALSPAVASATPNPALATQAAVASPTPGAAATSSPVTQSTSPSAHAQDNPSIPIGTPVSLTVVEANLRFLPTILGNVDRHR
jgi:hypothetical protein